jgi:hypothetical protein
MSRTFSVSAYCPPSPRWCLLVRCLRSSPHPLRPGPSPPGPSEGFLLDILRDETGVSFHRFQMAAWTVVLGFVFVISVYRSLAMPDFSATLLGLMGISAGTYIGFKIPDPPK